MVEGAVAPSRLPISWHTESSYSSRHGRGRGGATALALPEAKPQQKRRPITDPDVLARRSAVLVKARAVRAEKLAGARASR